MKDLFLKLVVISVVLLKVQTRSPKSDTDGEQQITHRSEVLVGGLCELQNAATPKEGRGYSVPEDVLSRPCVIESSDFNLNQKSGF